jgi:hypothetical protein
VKKQIIIDRINATKFNKTDLNMEDQLIYNRFIEHLQLNIILEGVVCPICFFSQDTKQGICCNCGEILNDEDWIQ